MNTKLILAGVSVLALAGCGSTGTTANPAAGIPLHGYAASYVAPTGDIALVEKPTVAYAYNSSDETITFEFSGGTLDGETLVINANNFNPVGGTLRDDVLDIAGFGGLHSAIGNLRIDDGSGDGTFVGLYAGSKPENINNLNGSASYSGHVIGLERANAVDPATTTFLLTANFTDASFTGEIKMGAADLSFAGAAGAINADGTYSGAFTGTATGEIDGAFYGPDAAETAGAFHAYEPGHDYFGVYHGVKN